MLQAKDLPERPFSTGRDFPRHANCELLRMIRRKITKDSAKRDSFSRMPGVDVRCGQ
jgi:hypothetical protein